MQLRYVLFIAITFFLLGCKKVLDVQPRDQFTDSDLYKTKDGFYAAASGIYNSLAEPALYGRAMSYEMIDIMAKRYRVDPANVSYVRFNQQDFSGDQNTFNVLWSNVYKNILYSNMLMDNISRHEGVLTKDEGDIMRGEMLTVRAFLHFDMLRLFGPRWENNAATRSIPYNEKAIAERLSLLPFETVITKIIRDLDEAETLLAKDPVITQGPMASAPTESHQSIQLRFRQFRFNYYSAIALKARVYLYAGKKPEALATAKRLLADPKLHQHFPPVEPGKLLANQVDPDRVFSSEVLTGIYVRTRDSSFKNTFDYANAPKLNYLQPYNQFLDRLFAFGSSTPTKEYEDYRYKTQWEPSPGGGHMFIKYKPITQPANSELFYSRMIPLIRLSEVYYIAAESEPNPADGFAWLNQMRPRRGLTPIDPGQYNTLAGQFTTLLANEYLREFYGEGQAFFFFKRTAYRQHHENGSAFAVSNYSDAAYRPALPTTEIIYH